MVKQLHSRHLQTPTPPFLLSFVLWSRWDRCSLRNISLVQALDSVRNQKGHNFVVRSVEMGACQPFSMTLALELSFGATLDTGQTHGVLVCNKQEAVVILLAFNDGVVSTKHNQRKQKTTMTISKPPLVTTLHCPHLQP